MVGHLPPSWRGVRNFHVENVLATTYFEGDGGKVFCGCRCDDSTNLSGT